MPQNPLISNLIVPLRLQRDYPHQQVCTSEEKVTISTATEYFSVSTVWRKHYTTVQSLQIQI